MGRSAPRHASRTPDYSHASASKRFRGALNHCQCRRLTEPHAVSPCPRPRVLSPAVDGRAPRAWLARLNVPGPQVAEIARRNDVPVLVLPHDPECCSGVEDAPTGHRCCCRTARPEAASDALVSVLDGLLDCAESWRSLEKAEG